MRTFTNNCDMFMILFNFYIFIKLCELFVVSFYLSKVLAIVLTFLQLQISYMQSVRCEIEISMVFLFSNNFLPFPLCL